MSSQGRSRPRRHLLDDVDLAQLLPIELAVSLIREALLAAERGRLCTPPRVAADVGDGRLTFTCGGVPGEWVGFRSYLAPGDVGDEQLVVVQDVVSGAIRAGYAGHDLGPLRTGAIGAVAVDALAPPGPVTLGVIGTGRQALAQVTAIEAVRGISALTVHSRHADHREAFVRGLRSRGIPAGAVADARSAVEGAGVVVLATSSPTPVLDLEWLAETDLVTTVGPKQVGRHEFPLGLADWGELLVTDSLAQLAAYDPPSVLAGTAHATRLVSLGAVLAGDVERRESRSVFYSVGLAGTEAHLLEAVTR